MEDDYVLNVDADSDKDIVDLRRLILAEENYSIAVKLLNNSDYGRALKCFEKANRLWPNQMAYVRKWTNCRKKLDLVKRKSEEPVDVDYRHQMADEHIVLDDGSIVESSLQQLLTKECPVESISNTTDYNIERSDDAVMDAVSEQRPSRSVYSVKARVTYRIDSHYQRNSNNQRNRYSNNHSASRRKRMLPYNKNYGDISDSSDYLYRSRY